MFIYGVEPPFAPDRPIKPVASYIGGKRNLVDLIETISHRTYAAAIRGHG